MLIKDDYAVRVRHLLKRERVVDCKVAQQEGHGVGTQRIEPVRLREDGGALAGLHMMKCGFIEKKRLFAKKLLNSFFRIHRITLFDLFRTETNDQTWRTV